MSRTKRSIWNFGSYFVFTIVTLVTSLAAVPFILRHLGSERLGAFQSFSALTSYALLLEFGLGGAMGALLAKAIGAGDVARADATIATGLRAYRRVAIRVAIGTALLTVISPLLIKLQPGTRWDLLLAGFVAMFVVMAIAVTPLRWELDASQRGYVVMAILLVQSLATTGSQVLFAWLGWGMTGQMLGAVIGAAAFTVGIAIASQRARPKILSFLWRPPEADAAVEVELTRLNRPNFLLGVATRVGLMTDTIVISCFLGPAAVVPFVFTQKLIQVGTGQVQSVGNAVWAGMAEIHARGEFELFNRRLAELTRVIVVLGVAVAIPTAVFNRSFISLWVGPSQYAGTLFTALVALNGLLLAVQSLWTWALTGTGHVGRLVAPNIIGAIVNIVSSVGLTIVLRHVGSRHGQPELGWLGPILGTTIAFVVVQVFWLPLLLRKQYGLRLRSLAAAVASPLIVGACFACATWYVSQQFAPSRWLTVGISMSMAGGLFLVIAWLCIFHRAEREMWIARIGALRRPMAERAGTNRRSNFDVASPAPAVGSGAAGVDNMLNPDAAPLAAAAIATDNGDEALNPIDSPNDAPKQGPGANA